MGELALIKSLLEGSGIPYVVHHEHVGSLYPGVPFLSGRVLVAEAERDRAETLSVAWICRFVRRRSRTASRFTGAVFVQEGRAPSI